MTAVVGANALARVAAPLSQPSPQSVIRSPHPIKEQYIVVLTEDQDSEAMGREAENVHSGRLEHIYRHVLRGFAIRLSEAAAEQLARDPRVEFVEEDKVVHAIQAATTWGLDRIDQRLLPPDGVFNVAGTGSGVGVHVLDTGIRTGHVEFGGRAHVGGDYVDDDLDGDPNDVANDDGDDATPDGLDCHGHGTHVAGTIGGATYGVAKNATIYAHRVLGCDGSGELSSVIAAIDAVTRDAQRPAVINMSFGGTASDAMDAAVRASIADGVTNVVAAGNDAADARESSPGRVAEAITVGATDASDFRAVFSNFGPGLDLFAPGVGIDSAWFSTDTAVRRLSGTSMAAPHVTGVVALYLEQNPTGTPAQARGALLSAATPNVISSPGAGSANLLLFAGTSETAYVSVQSPNGGERTFAGSPYLVTWFASGVSFTGFDVEFSADGGATFTLAAPCVGLAGNERSCVWTPPANTTTKGLIRVTGRHAAGAGQDRSNAFFNVRSDIPSVKVSVPTTAISWAHGTSQEIKWSHNLGANSFVRVELSRDGGGTFPEVLNESLKNASSSAGSYLWKVTGRNTANAMVRVSWTHGAAADASAVPFTITDPSLTMSSPSSTSTNWGFGTRQRVKWSTNLGKFATVQVLLSTDGGATYPTVLATKSASTQFADVTAPVLAAATGSARVRVIWVDGPAGSPLAALSPTFTIAPPFVRVTTPNGGQTWTAGTNAAVKWVSNLGALESLRMDLSTDGGASWPIVVVPGTASDGSHTLNVSGGWVGSTAKARLVWLKNAAITDASDAVFVIR